LTDILQFCKDILKINDKIRFAGIWFQSELVYAQREGLDRLLNDEETMKSVRGTVMRHNIRQTLTKQLGAPKFTINQYDKVCRITIPITKSDLFLVSTDIDCDVMSIAKQIASMKESFLQLAK